MEIEILRKLTVIPAFLWYWTVVLKIVLPRLEASFEPMVAALVVFAAAGALLSLPAYKGALIKKAPGAIIFLGSGAIALLTAVLSTGLEDAAFLFLMTIVLLSVGLALFCTAMTKFEHMFIATVGLGLMAAAVTVLTIV